MKVTDIINSNVAGLTTWIPFRDGISFEIRYVPRNELHRLSKECAGWEYDKQRHERVQSINREKFNKRFCEKAVLGWKGVTPSSLSYILPVDLTKLSAEEQVKDLDFSQENLLAVFNGAYEVDDFLQNAAIDVSLFKPFHEEEKGNSPLSPSGN